MPETDTLNSPKAKQDSMSTTQKSSRKAWWFFLCLSLVIFAMTLVVVDEIENTADVSKVEKAPERPLVSALVRTPSDVTAHVSAYSEVKPRWSVEIRSSVSGRIEHITDKAMAGEEVGQGDRLAKVEDINYRAEVTSAELAVEQARLELRQAQNNTTVARRQFKQSQRKPPNDLALHLPEQSIARTALKSAEVRLSAARKQLLDTEIQAPFSGFITERQVSPGHIITIGEPLFKLVDNSTYELVIELTKKDWSLLNHPLSGQVARVYSQSGQFLSNATVRKGSGFLDEQNRLHQIFLEIDSPPATVLSGDFVRVELTGRTLPDLLAIPESSLTQAGYVWYIDEYDRLQRVAPEIIFRHENRIYFTAPDSNQNWSIVRTPLASFIPGTFVQTKPASESAGIAQEAK